MSIQNYLRPLWSNGPHVVHDASSSVRTAFELLFKGKPRRQADSIVQLHRVRPLDVTVAWLEVEVSIPVEGTGLSYRRARYLHAFAMDAPGPDELTVRRARGLFEDVYGEDLIAGVHAAQDSLIGLEHPAGADRARTLFVGARPQPLRSHPKPNVAQREARCGRDEVAGPSSDGHGQRAGAPPVGDALPVPTTHEAGRPLEVQATGSVPPIFRDVDLLAPDLGARPTRSRQTPVEAFDRALASSAPAAADRRPAAATDERETIEPGHDDSATADAPSGESASLSLLLRARLVQRTGAGEPEQTKLPLHGESVS